MAKICNGNHSRKRYCHEHRCECPCGCKRDTTGYAFCVPCSFSHDCYARRADGKRAPHALSFYERFYGRGEKCPHNADHRMLGNLCGDCNERI